MPSDRWEEERQRVQHLGKQATDTVSPPFSAPTHSGRSPDHVIQISELSEATLDSVLATVQSLKVVCTHPIFGS